MKKSSYSYLFERYQIFKKDRRTNERHKYPLMFKITKVNSEEMRLDALGVDISISGIGFVSNIKFNINDILEIIFKYKKMTIPVTIKVAHVSLYDHGYFVGGQFIAIPNIYREILKQDLL